MSENQPRTGLVSYGGDSEISDSEMEDENTSMNNTPPNSLLFPQVISNSLGIPSLKPRTPSSPPNFVKPVVHSAPLGGLVAYYDEDDEHNDSREMDDLMKTDEVFPPVEQSDQGGSQPSPCHVESTRTPSPSDDQPEETDLNQELENQSPINTAPLFLPLNNVHLPPDSSAPCSKALQEKVKAILQKQAVLGIEVNTSIQERKDFRNPSIYKKLIDFSNLDEFGTNYPEHLYNPHEWKEEDYYDNLLKAQKKAYEKKEKAKLERSKVEFVTGMKRPGLLGAQPSVDPLKKQRRTKWDIGTSGTDSGGSRGTSPSGVRGSLLGAGPGTGGVGAQAKAQASSLMNIDLTRNK